MSFDGRKRSAVFGIRIASGRRAIWTFRFAVMPGFSRRSSFGTLIIVA
jgi:hypothetical protein